MAASYEHLVEKAASARYGLMESQYVVVDTETTGLKAGTDELIEIAAAIMDGPDVVDTFQTFVNPGRHITEFITDLTTICDDDVADAPEPAEAVAMLHEFAGNRTCIAHNARFDRSFLEVHAPRGSVLADHGRWIDTLPLSRIAMPRLVSHDQASMCDAFGIRPGGHRAQGDVEALCRLWRIMLAALDDLPHDMLGFIAQIAPDARWPLRDVIATVAGDGMEKRFSMYALRDRMIADDARRSVQPDGEGNATSDDASGSGAAPGSGAFAPDLAPTAREQVEQAFSPEGIVGAMYDNFEQRPEQVEFALQVAEAFRTSTHRVVEAGTGVGKSVSYLLPAVMFALANQARVGVATKTNTLLDQLMYKELPRLARAVEQKTGQRFAYIALKGYDHYPCLRKVMRFAKEADAQTPLCDIEMLAMIVTSMSQAAWGDLDALSVSLTRNARMHMVCSSEDCLHGKCSFYPSRCLLHGARRRANDAQVIVTNHALMFRDVASDNAIIPSVNYWVVDEAHGVEEEARKQLSYSVEAAELSAFLRKLGSSSGVVSTTLQKATGLDGGTTVIAMAAAVKREIAPMEEVAELFFSAVKGLGALVQRSSYATSEIWINPERRRTPEWAKVLETGELMVRQLDSLMRSCRHLLSMAEDFDELSEQVSELSQAICTMSEMLECISLTLDGTNSAYYYYVKVHRDAKKQGEVLYASLVDVGAELSEKFFPEENSVILTSATVAVGESFDYFAHRVGLDRIDREMWSGERLEPSDGFYDNMRTLVVGDLPDPRSEGYSEALGQFLVDVHLGMGGGVLTLFTNRRDMQRIYDQINPVLKRSGIELLCQSSGKSKRMLQDAFTGNEETCLFATRSFWEGFDAPGRTLRCVVLPRLPFSRPDDPLYQERSARTKDAWKSYVLPQAIIDTKQAAGRLIRSRSDSGFLIMCDKRLTSMWYGKMFLKSLPRDTLEKASAADVRAILESSHI